MSGGTNGGSKWDAPRRRRSSVCGVGEGERGFTDFDESLGQGFFNVRLKNVFPRSDVT